MKFYLNLAQLDNTPEFKEWNDTLIGHFQLHIKILEHRLKTAENIQKWDIGDKKTFSQKQLDTLKKYFNIIVESEKMR